MYKRQDRDLADDELDNLLGAMTAINQRQQQAALRNGVTPVQIGLTVKSTREFEYWYVDKEDRDAVAAFIEEAMLLAKLNPNQRSWSKGYRLLFFSANVDYPIEE